MPNLTTYLKTYRLGDIVDVKANAAVQLGMPHKYYHGKTGRVFNVTPRAVGIIMNKRVNTRIVAKRIHVRVEHVSHSKCRQDFINRVKKNETLKREARKNKRKWRRHVCVLCRFAIDLLCIARAAHTRTQRRCPRVLSSDSRACRRVASSSRRRRPMCKRFVRRRSRTCSKVKNANKKERVLCKIIII